MATVRERDEEDHENTGPSPKRAKVEDVIPHEDEEPMQVDDDTTQPESLLPPSHALLNVKPATYTPEGTLRQILETDVGISEYVGHGIPMIKGIIKQRFTDFLVYEVDLDGNTIHLKSLEKPESSPDKKPKADEPTVTTAGPIEESTSLPEGSSSNAIDADPVTEVVKTEEAAPEAAKEEKPTDPNPGKSKPTEPWPASFDDALKPYLSEDLIGRVKTMFLEGPEPPFVPDSGWGGRQTKAEGDDGDVNPGPAQEEKSKSDRGRRGGRGNRGARGGRGRGGRMGGREDNRRVLSEPISSKATRTGLHQVVRELFKGKLETETDTTTPDDGDGSRIVIKWSHGRSARGGRGGNPERGERSERSSYPPYIHFTLQKTNRDTQDALAHLSRLLHVTVKDLSVAGTKDKRGVTVQRVSLKRNNKTVEDVWRLANGLVGRRTAKEAVTQRGERGIRIADFNYRRASLELGMLKGNAFVITLRNVQVDSADTLDRALETIKTKGFINYYGMQRFGTAAIPTHTIGLALLKSDWHQAVSLILRKRPGEHPDVEAARSAWLVDGDLDKALELMPRRVVAERCLLESYKKQGGDTRNAFGALSTIPKNLRLMYIHAYQSYVWNAIVSERIRIHGAERPVVGDLVFDTGSEKAETEDIEAGDGSLENEVSQDKAIVEDSEDHSTSRPNKRARKPWEAPKVKTLTEVDLDKHTIFDVIMPLPGRDVAFPGGSLGERYREFLEADGLDPDNFERKQKEYSLGGSYRKILHLPKELSWSVLRYTDPDVALAQADEDKLLGFDPPAIVEDGKFMALQIQLTLGTAAYATMALREVTKTETSSQFQAGLTQASEDQKYRTAPDAEPIGESGT